MPGLRSIMIAASMAAVALVSASFVAAKAASPPAPPPKVCVNNQCVSTPTPAPSPAPVANSGNRIKWNPGHYMASYSALYGGDTFSKVQYELDDLNNQDAILGYRMYITWGALETSKGTYDFSLIDQILTRLKTAYNKPKRLVVYLWLYDQSSLGSNDGSMMPMYLQQDPAYGPSPVAGSYGWWGANANGKSTGMYAASLYYSPVMDRLIALVQALGAHLDSDPYVEAIHFQEDATIAQTASSLGSVSPNYSDGAWLAQLQRLLTAATSAFPHTSVVMENSWFNRPASSVSLQQWMATNRIAPGTADSWGQSSLTAHGYGALSDGMQTYLGVDQSGGTTDLRPVSRAMIDVQGPDIFGGYFAKYGGPWTPLDLINAANQTYQASHVFWTHLFGTETFLGSGVPAAAKWSNLAATCAANPLTHTAYPSNYPQ